ncbi:FAD-containing oxidoreductase [Macrococcoides canis]|uniref:hypothiocyanous acid reductase MerA n=1 Tax=Macrococcoides canis TaxID=1855823 RepID=UPI0020B6CEF6|nr:hypothiocyanous acid reductase MerA [Macrococcus canis]UTH02753.1 FAD-containing oxidoreductase [Macrococcus canis]
MNNYDLLVIGFGKAGKTLAAWAGKSGKRVAVVEQSKEMYGGTCINIGCIPSKVLVHDGISNHNFNNAMTRKREVVSALNDKNYHNLADNDFVDVIDGKAQFISNEIVAIVDQSGNEIQQIKAAHIIINTGAKPVIPEIDGIASSKYLYDSTGIMNLNKQPERLVIVGGGYIALEFASMFANFRSDVTVLERSPHILKREDEEIAEMVIEDLKEKGITFITDVEVEQFEDQEGYTVVRTTQGDFEAEAVLIATGREPNTDIGIEHTDITLGDHGEIKVDEKLRTNVPHIFAVGDVKGGMQFTYISLDDYRIVKDELYGKGERTTNNRGTVPYTVFIDPPLSRVGLTAAEALEKGYEIIEGKLPVKNMPRHKINNDPRGLFKVLVDKETKVILGATLYGQSSEEIINIIKLAIDQQISYEVLRDNVYTHPTMSESLNDLFNI